MKRFSQLIEENKSGDSFSILQSEITTYINKVKGQLSYDIQKIIYATQKFDLTSSDQIDEIRFSTKSKLKDLVDKYNIPLNELTNLWEMLKTAKKNIRLLPQYQSKAEREEIEAGRLSMDDLTIDLSSTQGRNAASKMYMPVVLKIVKSYEGKSRLDKHSLMSAALMGMTDAMNDWKREPDEKNEKTVSFKSYLVARVRQQILNDINKFGHSLSGTNSYAAKEYGSSLLDAVSLDGIPGDDDFKQDRIAALGVEEPTGDKYDAWESLYKLIEKTFSVRDVDIFYRFFGLNGRKREKSKDIAKSYNMSEGNIRNSILNKILKWLRTNPRASEILSDIQDMYTEHLMCDMLMLNKEQIIETLAMDDVYILLEELNKWKNKYIFDNTLAKAVKATQNPEIETMLAGGFSEIDDNIKTYKKDIITFLSCMYPAEKFTNKSDVELIEYMQEISNAYKKYKK